MFARRYLSGCVMSMLDAHSVSLSLNEVYL